MKTKETKGEHTRVDKRVRWRKLCFEALAMSLAPLFARLRLPYGQEARVPLLRMFQTFCNGPSRQGMVITPPCFTFAVMSGTHIAYAAARS